MFCSAFKKYLIFEGIAEFVLCAILVGNLNMMYRCMTLFGVLAVIVDPFDENAISFYKKYGFILIPSNNKMFIPIKTIHDFL